MKPRAFLLEPVTLSIDKAEKFGDVVRMFDDCRSHPNPFNPSFQTAVVERLEELKFHPDCDYVILTGSMLSLVCMLSAAVKFYGYARALCYNGHCDVDDYQVITMGSSKLDDMLDALEDEEDEGGSTTHHQDRKVKS